MKEIEVLVVKHQTDGGIIFENKSDAVLHEGLLDGSIKICPRCEGSGVVDYCGDGRVFVECSKCKGSGYLHKQITWSSK